MPQTSTLSHEPQTQNPNLETRKSQKLRNPESHNPKPKTLNLNLNPTS